MDVDVLITGVTGFVGRFVLLELIEKHPLYKIGVIIRSLKNKSPIERFHEEIINDTLFSKYTDILSKVNVIGTSIEDIEKTSLYIKAAKCIIHCAANVKHYDPYSKLLQDNVNNIQVILRLAEKLECKKLILLSTCYVHLKDGSTNGEVKRIPKASRELFYNDYCYTKWLGEEEIFNAKTLIPEINIVRLSCVGAPLDKNLQSHPFSAQAHLGIISLASRGYLTAVGLTPDARLSIIPVDLVSKYIVGLWDTKYKTIEEPIIHQVCPPKKLDTFHPNLINIFAIAQYELGINSLRTVIHDGTSSNYLPVWYSFLRLINKKADRFVDLHDKVQEFVLLFTSTDIRFDSSLPDTDFPVISEKQFLLDTFNFSIRTSQQLQFKKGVPLTSTDKLVYNIGNREPIQVCCTLNTPINIDGLPKLKDGLWALFNSNRKFSCIIDNNKWLYKPNTYDSYFGQIDFDDSDDFNESLIISKGYNKYNTDSLWHCDFITHKGLVTHCHFQVEHSVADGVGLIRPLLNKVDYYTLDKPIMKYVTPTRSKGLNIFQELIVAISFISFIFGAYFLNDSYRNERVSTPSISTNTVPIVKHKNKTFTTNLLWKLVKSLATHTQLDNFIICVPSVISANRSEDKIINNNFVPILIPVSSTMTEEQFEKRCRILKSKAVIFMMWCIQELISTREWWWLKDKFMSKVTAIVSSVNVGANMPSLFSSIHIATNTPSPIPFCISAVSDIKNTFLTVRSHDSAISASKILADIC